MITQEKLKEIFTYNPDGKLVRNISTARLAKVGDIAGNYDKKLGYNRVSINGKSYLLHRIVFLYHYGYMPKILDHINGIKTDNRIENLRPASQEENSRNRCKNNNNASGYKNVSWHNQHKKWAVTMHLNGKKKHFGYFEDIELADLVAQEARVKYHGQFAHNV
jgi:hypothetical protein